MGVDPRKPPTWEAGSPDYSAIIFFGIGVYTNAAFRADNLFIDRIDVGYGIRAYGTGTSNDSWQDILDDDMGTSANVWGIAQEQDGVIYLYGRVDIGDNQGSNGTSFSDRGRIIQWVKQEYYDSNGNWVPLIGDDLFQFNIVGNGDAATVFTDGVIVGSDGGRSGSTFIGSELHRTRIDLYDGSHNDNDVNLYGTVFKNIKSGITWGNDGDHVFFGGSVIACGLFDPVGAPILRNLVIAETQAFDQDCVDARMDDGGSFTDETTDAADLGGGGDVNLLPGTPAVNDAFYFGHTSKFDTIDILITTAGSGNTLAWEYWDGDSWEAVTGLADGSAAFSKAFLCRVTFTIPGDWATTTVDSQGPYYYIRARVSGAGNQAVAERIWLDGPPDASALLWNPSINIQESQFIAHTDDTNDPHAIEHPYSGEIDYNALFFSGNDYDIHYTATSGDLNIGKLNLSDPQSYENEASGEGDVNLSLSATLAVHVEDEDGGDIQGAFVFIDETPVGSPYVMNTTTDGGGDASTGYAGAGGDMSVRVRKYGYKPYSQTWPVSGNLTVNVVLIEDPQQV